MKANRKFLTDRDEAVSPVIAVILMVAITVVLAATVYVWVSGFGAQSSTPAKSMSFTSASSITTTANGTGHVEGDYKLFTVASATAGLKYADIDLALAGSELTFVSTGGCTTDLRDELALERWNACAGSTNRVAEDVVRAGDTITIKSAAGLSGKTLTVLDPMSNSIMLTLTVA